MTNTTESQFGGEWTREKLEILRKYLDAYTTALKKTPFRLLYIDAFAGTGSIESGSQDPDQKDRRAFIDGSTRIALDIVDRSFDELIFIEKDEAKCSILESLKAENLDRNIVIETGDANNSLRALQKDWSKWRGVLFLDPFGAQVDWSTLEAIAGYKALDIWILFPTSTIVRMLPRSKLPDEIHPSWARTLTRVFGGERWRDVYDEDQQIEMFPENIKGPQFKREPGVNKLREIYKEGLRELLDRRFLDQSRPLKNSKNSDLYEFMFCVGSDNQAAIKLAKRIAKHLVDKL